MEGSLSKLMPYRQRISLPALEDHTPPTPCTCPSIRVSPLLESCHTCTATSTSHTSHTSHLPQHQNISPPGFENLVTHVLRQLTAVTLGHDERLYRQLCGNTD